MATGPLNFKPLDDEARGPSRDEAFEILALFESALDSSPDPSVDEKAKLFVEKFIPYAAKQTGNEARDFAQITWDSFAYISTCIPHKHYALDVLAKTVHLLHCAGEPWRDLPEMWMSIREASNNSPILQRPDFVDNENEAEFTLEEWLNFNSFVARLHGTLTGGLESNFGSFALWAMRDGLEADDPIPDSMVDIQVLVCADWIIHAARQILKLSLLNILANEPDREGGGSSWNSGKLLPGRRGFTLERWGFWKRRLGILRHDGRISESSYASIDEAIDLMTAVEKEVAEKWDQTS